MGMDISGKNPSTRDGEYFRNNVWWWRPVLIYLADRNLITDEEATKMSYNDGAGLEHEQCVNIAEFIEQDIADGGMKKWEDEYMANLNALPDKECHCVKEEKEGMSKVMVGIETMARKAGAVLSGGEIEPWAAPDPNCGSCKGTGSVRPFDTNYPFEVTNMAEFGKFLKGCGGFEVW